MRSLLLGLGILTGGAIGTLPTVVIAQTTEPTPPMPSVQPESKTGSTLSGKVEARTDTTITIGGRTISTNPTTRYTRNGASINRSDVRIGDKVNVVVSDNGQVAVSVDVLSAE